MDAIAESDEKRDVQQINHPVDLAHSMPSPTLEQFLRAIKRSLENIIIKEEEEGRMRMIFRNNFAHLDVASLDDGRSVGRA